MWGLRLVQKGKIPPAVACPKEKRGGMMGPVDNANIGLVLLQPVSPEKAAGVVGEVGFHQEDR